MKYRKRPIIIEAFQMTRKRRIDNSQWPEWLHLAWQEERGNSGSAYPTIGTGDVDGTISLMTLEGEHLVLWNDWIIRGVQGELYPCKPDIFELTYDQIEPESEKPEMEK